MHRPASNLSEAVLSFKRHLVASKQPCSRLHRPCCGCDRATFSVRLSLRAGTSICCKFPPVQTCGRLVVQDCLDDVRRDPKIGHPRGDASAQVMDGPSSSTPRRASSAALPADHAVKPRAPNSVSRDAMRGVPLMMSSMAGISGSVWAWWFLARAAGSVHVDFSKSISLQHMPPISNRLAPVRISNLTQRP